MRGRAGADHGSSRRDRQVVCEGGWGRGNAGHAARAPRAPGRTFACRIRVGVSGGMVSCAGEACAPIRDMARAPKYSGFQDHCTFDPSTLPPHRNLAVIRESRRKLPRIEEQVFTNVSPAKRTGACQYAVVPAAPDTRPSNHQTQKGGPAWPGRSRRSAASAGWLDDA